MRRSEFKRRKKGLERNNTERNEKKLFQKTDLVFFNSKGIKRREGNVCSNRPVEVEVALS